MGRNWTQEELDALTRDARRITGIPNLPRPIAKGKSKQPRGMNKTEAAYAAHLEMEKRIGDVLWYKFEGITLKLAHDCRLTIDFAVMLSDGTIELHDTKSLWSKSARPHIEDDALVKLRTAAEMYPFKVRAVWRAANGEWDSKEF